MKNNYFFTERKIENKDKNIEKQIIEMLKVKLSNAIKKQLGKNSGEQEFNDFFQFLIDKMRKTGEIQKMVEEYNSENLQTKFSKMNLSN